MGDETTWNMAGAATAASHGGQKQQLSAPLHTPHTEQLLIILSGGLIKWFVMKSRLVVTVIASANDRPEDDGHSGKVLLETVKSDCGLSVECK